MDVIGGSSTGSVETGGGGVGRVGVHGGMQGRVGRAGISKAIGTTGPPKMGPGSGSAVGVVVVFGGGSGVVVGGVAVVAGGGSSVAGGGGVGVGVGVHVSPACELVGGELVAVADGRVGTDGVSRGPQPVTTTSMAAAISGTATAGRSGTTAFRWGSAAPMFRGRQSTVVISPQVVTAPAQPVSRSDSRDRPLPAAISHER